MKIIATFIDNVELIKLFVSASLNADSLALEYLLADDGVFEIENDNFELVDSSKKEFLKWYNYKIKETTIT
jgi:hypothetical protein